MSDVPRNCDCSFIQDVQIDWCAVTGDTGVGGEGG